VRPPNITATIGGPAISTRVAESPRPAFRPIFAFRFAWNDFLWPLIAVNKPDMFPLPVALAFLRGAYSNESYSPIMAGAVLSTLPLFFAFPIANRRIVEGVQLSGLKG
jgi:multiple sugar transport system permease protein